MTKVLEVTNLTKHFGGIKAVDRRLFRCAGRRDPRPDRPEWLREIDAVQLHPRPARADRRRSQARRPGHHRHAAVRPQSPRRQPHLPTAAGLPQLSVRENLILAGQEHRGHDGRSASWARAMPDSTPDADRMIGFSSLSHLADEKAGGLELRPAEAARRRDGLHGRTAAGAAR